MHSLSASKFRDLIRELKTPHLYILRGDLKIPADSHLLEVLNEEIQQRENKEQAKMSIGALCDRCKPSMLVSAIGYIPTGDAKRINVCQRHHEEAVERCYFVVRNGDSLDYSPDFDKRTWDKHVRLRGSRRLKFRTHSRVSVEAA